VIESVTFCWVGGRGVTALDGGGLTHHYMSLARSQIFLRTDENSDKACSDVTCLSLARHKGLTDWTLGWVDIGTRARVPLRFVVYLKKSRGNDKKLVFSSNHFSVGPGHSGQYTI
jgi:hypothetical protein